MYYKELLNLDQFLLFFVVFVVCTIGAYTKNTIDTFRRKTEILLREIIISSLFISIIVWCFSEFVVGKIGFKPFIAIDIILGMVSYELTLKFTSIAGIKQLLNDFNDFRSYKQLSTTEKTKKENKK